MRRPAEHKDFPSTGAMDSQQQRRRSILARRPFSPISSSQNNVVASGSAGTSPGRMKCENDAHERNEGKSRAAWPVELLPTPIGAHGTAASSDHDTPRLSRGRAGLPDTPATGFKSLFDPDEADLSSFSPSAMVSDDAALAGYYRQQEHDTAASRPSSDSPSGGASVSYALLEDESILAPNMHDGTASSVGHPQQQSGEAATTSASPTVTFDLTDFSSPDPVKIERAVLLKETFFSSPHATAHTPSYSAASLGVHFESAPDPTAIRLLTTPGYGSPGARSDSVTGGVVSGEVRQQLLGCRNAFACDTG